MYADASLKPLTLNHVMDRIFTIVSTQNQANMGVGGMGGKCILLLLWIIFKSKYLERNLLEFGKAMSSQLLTGCRGRSLKTSPDFSACVDMQLREGTWHLFQVSLLFPRISVPCLIVWLEILTLGKLLTIWICGSGWWLIHWSPVCNWTENLTHCSSTF